MFDGYLLEVCPFPMRNRKGMDLEGWRGREQLEEIEGHEILIGIYYMKKRINFQQKQTNKM